MKKSIAGLVCVLMVFGGGLSIASTNGLGGIGFELFCMYYEMQASKSEAYDLSFDTVEEKKSGEDNAWLFNVAEGATLVIAADLLAETKPVTMAGLRVTYDALESDMDRVLDSIAALMLVSGAIEDVKDAPGLMEKMDLGVDNKFEGSFFEGNISHVWSMLQDNVFMYVITDK